MSPEVIGRRGWAAAAGPLRMGAGPRQAGAGAAVLPRRPNPGALPELSGRATPDRVSVLLVDDDDVDAESVIRSLRRSDIPLHVLWVEDGLEALEVLRDEHAVLRLERPFVVLLDLNMPRMDGFEFLHAVRSDPQLRDTVVFVLSTSATEADRTRAYHENIAGYLIKSSVGPQFSKLARLLAGYQAAVTLP